MATSGDADVALVYAPAVEQRYVKSGEQSPAAQRPLSRSQCFSG
jgi:ABC-type tungstate transport system permease subunit